MISRIIDQAQIEQLSKYLDIYNKIVITIHTSPDGDAVGSSLGLQHILLGMGKDVTVIAPDSLPANIKFLPKSSDIVVYDKAIEEAQRIIDESEMIICLDHNAPKRMSILGDAIVNAKATKVLIDHHLYPESFCDLIISYPKMTSTCELLFRVLTQLELVDKIDTATAECIYTGMMTDTGNFSYNSNSSDLYLMVAELMTRGIDKDKIYSLAINCSSEDALRLRSYAISEKMIIDYETRSALITLNRAELRRFNYRRGDTESLVNMPLAIPDVDWVLFMRQDDKMIKISTRSKGNFAVNTICSKYFNGGGHKNASGGEFFGSMATAIDTYKRIIADLKATKKVNTELKNI
ncbi:MAG: bifunctional oligoribonuclease/PAP phosphatase NrnA [Bacteroidales bacterium]